MFYIGVDLGGTNIAAGLVSFDGSILISDSIPTGRFRPVTEIVDDIVALCEKLVCDYGLSFDDVSSIGIGSPGIVDSLNGVLVRASNFNFSNFPIRDIVKNRLNVPVFVGNDANCAALGESICGAAKGFKNSITVTLGTGLGAGIVIDGKIFSGSFFAGGEVGHHVIVVNGEQCTCGRKGCFEAYASATALIRQARVAVANSPNCAIVSLADGDINLITAKTVFDAAHSNDSVALELVDSYIEYLSEGLANLINIIQPEIIVVGGGISAQGDYLLLPLVKRVNSKVYGNSGDFVKLKIATLGNDAGIIGAALIQKYS